MIVYRDLSEIPPISSSVITIGSFDGIHFAHKKIINLLQAKAREYETKSIIITFSPHPRFVLSQNEENFKLLSTDNEKIKYLEQTDVDILVIVPFTFEFSRQHPLEYIEKFLYQKFNPKVIILGHDHRFGLNRSGDINLLRQYETLFSYKILQISREDYEDIAISSSKIRGYLAEGNISTANIFLGRNYSFIAKVIHGNKLGTKLGYPTANLEIDQYKLIPAKGVYSCLIQVGSIQYKGMMYIGKKHYASTEPEDVIEVNIFDFDHDIYGETIEVELIDFIRPGVKFTGKDQIIRQLAIDKENVEKSLASIKPKLIQKKKVAIVILNYNGVDYLDEFLESVIYNTGIPARIIIADNASTDNSVDFLNQNYPEVEIYELSHNFGFSLGYNRVIKSLKGVEYVVFLNSDVEVTEGWLEPLIDIMDKDKTIAIAQPKILSFNEKQFFEYAGAAGGYIDRLCYPFCRGRLFDSIEKDEGQYDNNREVFWASGAAMVMRKKVFTEMKGFDPDFFAHQEEIDLAWRVKRCGYKVMAIGNSSVYHVGGGTLSYVNPKKTYLNFRNNLIMMLKNDHKRNIAWKFPLRLILDGIAALKFLFEGKTGSVKAILEAHVYVYFHIFGIIGKRIKYNKLIQKARIDNPRKTGKYKGFIIYEYYFRAKRKFSELPFRKI
ncbi:MAG: bifunctional riboflavin kinase/FAD synthetase [Deltaproteobacteria bacterium]